MREATAEACLNDSNHEFVVVDLIVLILVGFGHQEPDLRVRKTQIRMLQQLQ